MRASIGNVQAGSSTTYYVAKIKQEIVPLLGSELKESKEQ
jgi:hypothetical protein